MHKVLPVLFAVSFLITGTLGAMVLPRLPAEVLLTRDDWPLVDSRIVGGSVAYDGEFPYQVSLQRQGPGGSWYHFCGGSIYTSQTVITAAHCVTALASSSVSVVAGSNVLDGTSAERQIASVSWIKQHEDYDSNRMSNDIALIRLKDTFELSGYVGQASIPQQGAGTKSGTNCVVTGWGTTAENGSSSNTLMKVYVPVVSENKCEKSYGNKNILNSMICAGYSDGGADACQGDSGGPLVIKDTKTLVGIVSWGYGCARPGYYGVYTRVSYYTNWIRKNSAYSINSASSSSALLIFFSALFFLFFQKH